MKEIIAYFNKLKGNNYDVGRQLAVILKKNNPKYAKWIIKRKPVLNKKRFAEIINLINEYCPGLNNEIDGFADEFNVTPDRLIFYSWTYLIPGCSHISILPSLTENNHTLVLRNYELNEKFDDMMIFHTNKENVNSHIGFSVLLFGRSEGINEHGLCVTMSSCGIPVGNAKGMNKPGIKGLQFWIIVRAILEQCNNVNDSLKFIKNIPFGYNINLIITDKTGVSVLIETYNGEMKIIEINSKSGNLYLCATNHIIFKEFSHYEPGIMKHSKIRFDLINNIMKNTMKKINKDFLKSLIKNKYPKGLTCHNYKEYFGTIRSMIFDLNNKSIDLCIGSPVQSNDWQIINFNDKTEHKIIKGKIFYEKYGKDFWEFI